jgi:PAS domain-containing protein
MSIRSSHNYLQTPDLMDKLQARNFTTQFVSQLHAQQQFTGVLVLYGGDQFMMTPTLKSILSDATMLVESVISLEYDNELSRRALEEQTLLDSTFGAGKGVTIIVNAQGHLLYVNSVVRELFGMTKTEALNVQKIEHFIDAKDRHRVVSAVTKSKQNPKLARYVDCIEFHRRAQIEEDAKTEEESNHSDYENDSFYLDLKIQGLWDDPAVNGCLVSCNFLATQEGLGTAGFLPIIKFLYLHEGCIYIMLVETPQVTHPHYG